MREAAISRKTAETDISVYINLDGNGESEITSGVGFMDHMLTLMAKHSGFDVRVRCVGDTNVDDHHSVEDIGIALGQALKQALSDKIGIRRYGDAILPMDEALVMTAVDLSGRGYLGYELDIPSVKIGSFDSELIEEFFVAITRTAEITLHLRQLAGKNSHHIAECAFKSFARAMRTACEIDPRFSEKLPSTKGAL